MAALNGQIAVARLLIERGANVNADDFWAAPRSGPRSSTATWT
jgi:ankyrin repeat protein